MLFKSLEIQVNYGTTRVLGRTVLRFVTNITCILPLGQYCSIRIAIVLVHSQRENPIDHGVP